MGSLVVLMGPTGAGKSVQGDLLAEYYHGVHLSSGKLLRQDSHAAARIRDGRLAPAEEVERVVGEAMARIPEDTLIVLDGTPRTESNVEWLQKNLPGLHRKLVKVIVIDLDVETSMRRLGTRGRADDGPAAVREKWQLFDTVTRPIVELYRESGILAHVDGRGGIQEVHELIVATLKEAIPV
ncbi:MAG TPA: nucleoside monophosphate kinase [Candidatus Saccharimonadia bacterium]|nr:nucleoside monophosphate kinase [Candidatus Saccharimonadia bacterium]